MFYEIRKYNDEHSYLRVSTGIKYFPFQTNKFSFYSGAFIQFVKYDKYSFDGYIEQRFDTTITYYITDKEISGDGFTAGLCVNTGARYFFCKHKFWLGGQISYGIMYTKTNGEITTKVFDNPSNSTPYSEMVRAHDIVDFGLSGVEASFSVGINF